MKKVFILFLVIVLCMAMPMTVLAADRDYLKIATNTSDTDALRAMSGTSSISRESDTSVRITGTTISSPSSQVSVQLQVYKDGSWHNFGSAISKDGSSRATATKVVSITRGYSYRTKSIHNGGTVSYSRSLLM